MFSHGKDSEPWGSKIAAMAEIAREEGFHVESVDYRGIDDPQARVTRLLALDFSRGLGKWRVRALFARAMGREAVTYQRIWQEFLATNSVCSYRALGATLPWRGRVAERSEAGWGDCRNICLDFALTPPRLARLRFAATSLPTPPLQGRVGARGERTAR